MGCDIHICLERKDQGKWVNWDNWRVNPIFHSRGENEYDEAPMRIEEVWEGRNYYMFGALAGVRRECPMVAPPKGFPEDACKYSREAYESWDSDAHTPSWLTLRELAVYASKYPSHGQGGMVSPEAAEALDKGVLPDSWSAWTNIEGHVTREWERPGCVLDPLIEAIRERTGARDWYWPQTDDMEAEVRIVFWFDN